MSVPSLLKVFCEAGSAPEQFTAKLRRLASQNGGKLPLTHESPIGNWDSIKRDGAIKGDGSIFMTVGHLDKPSFVTKHGVIIHVNLPVRLITPGTIVPDMRFDGEDDMLRQFPNLVGGEVSVGMDKIPRSLWTEVLDNRTGEKLE